MTLNILRILRDKLGYEETSYLTDRERALLVLLDLCMEIDEYGVCRSVKQTVLKTSVSRDALSLKLLLEGRRSEEKEKT